LPETKYDAVIIGGGAAGLFCAIEAGKRGLRVAVLEHNAEVGRKIIISGGGRCNFTNIHTSPENFISQNPHFAKSALAGYTPQDFVELVKKHKIPFYEKKLGQLFCRDSSRAIVEMLQAECRRARVEVITSCSVFGVDRGELFQIETSRGTFVSKNLVVACGGLSFAKIGATGLGYDIARQFGMKIVETRPSLVAMVMKKGASPELAGVSVDSRVSSGKQAFRENILFTHRGLSGPAILQISNYWDPGSSVSIDLVPDADVIEMLRRDKEAGKTVVKALAELLPARLAEMIAAGTHKKRLADMPDKEIEGLAWQLSDRRVEFTATEGYDRAEVTLGGVSTAELSSKTMESKKAPGLYFIGEVVDVTGWLGGYNFQWAWSSAFAAAQSL
jgi:predicted Rossmann fold flavoprotein